MPTHAGSLEVISYWFFFALSPAGTPHEGDWQALSVMVPDDDTEIGVRYDSTSGGLTCGFADTERVDGTHPVAYVEAGSHAMSRSADDLEGGAAEAATQLRSWELEPVRVPTLAWSSFDGAWGRVGPGPRSTGPLGPLFRREAAGTMNLL